VTLVRWTRRNEDDASETMFRRLLEAAPDAMVIVDEDGTIAIVNARAGALFGYAVDDLLGQSVELLVPGGLAGGVGLQGRRIDGSEFPAEISVNALETLDGRVLFSSAIRDVSERHRFEGQLHYLAHHDPVTDLFNRRRFFEDLERMLALGERYGEQVALLVLDLDHFKFYNDTAGHRAGDELVRVVGVALQHRLRETDVLARLSGDEFAVLLPQSGAESAHAVAEGLLAAVRSCDVTSSIGIALSEAGVSPEELLTRADLAMYEVKERGRDGIGHYTPETHRRLTATQDWEERIRRSLADDTFELVLQPIVTLGSGAIDNGELLLRMRGDAGQIISPSDFLPVAERTGLIGDIDRWVARRAIELLANDVLPISNVEVNVSARSLDDADLLAFIELELERAAINPSRLVFEITETAAVSNMDHAMRFAERLARLGCGFALDDFGTGFASFYYLKHLPIDYVKIDGDFIRELPATPTDQLMVRAITQVAQGLQMKTIAEWVADEETMLLLREYGIDYAQGYHVGAPRPVAWSRGLIPS
jgi:diguanylate cyclase (GGDEF)-like protein